MKTTIEYKGRQYEIDLSKPIDISIPVGRKSGPNAFYLPEPQYGTVEAGSFIGDVNRGGSCNVENISFSPHGNGTHTECAGHILADHQLVNKILDRYFFLANLITVMPEVSGSNSFINKEAIMAQVPDNTDMADAIIIRTLPNESNKRTTIYSGSNPVFLNKDALTYLNESGFCHLLTDLPSVDKEDDNTLSGHFAFFKDIKESDMDTKNDFQGESGRNGKTITEMIYVANDIPDGLYWLDLQIAGFESDASPSRPVLYACRLIHI